MRTKQLSVTATAGDDMVKLSWYVCFSPEIDVVTRQFCKILILSSNKFT